VSARGTWLASRWARLTGPERLAGIDLARGLAVLGMLAAHLLVIPEWQPSDPSTVLGIVHGRSSILFAMLAGVSIGLVSGGRAPVVGAALQTTRLRLAVRAVVLWLIGLLLIATGVPVFVILPAYAVLFLLAVPLIPLGARVLLPLAAGLALVMPFVQVLLDGLPVWSGRWGLLLEAGLGWHYPFPVWIAYLCAGLGIARLGLRRLRVQIALVVAGVALAVVGYGLGVATAGAAASAEPAVWQLAWSAASHSNGVLEAVGSGGFALAVIGGCLLACRTILQWVTLPLRAVGSMPLTAYVAQIVVWAVWAAVALGGTGDLGGFRDLGPYLPLVTGTVLGCTAWALLIGRGPLEAGIDRVARLVVRRR
jgi:uncharacterized membrane protein YeiB